MYGIYVFPDALATLTDLRIDNEEFCMSDTADDIEFQGRQLLNKSKTDPLRERMRQFLTEHESNDFKTLREEVSEEKPLSDIVDEDREERL